MVRLNKLWDLQHQLMIHQQTLFIWDRLNQVQLNDYNNNNVTYFIKNLGIDHYNGLMQDVYYYSQALTARYIHSLCDAVVHYNIVCSTDT